jgi:hypothetical protein
MKIFIDMVNIPLYNQMICDLKTRPVYYSEMEKLCVAFENMSISRVGLSWNKRVGMEMHSTCIALNERVDKPLELEYTGETGPLEIEEDEQFEDAVGIPSIPDWEDWKKHAFLDEELEMYYMHWFNDRDVDMDSNSSERRCAFFRGTAHLCGYAEDFKKGGKYYATEL